MNVWTEHRNPEGRTYWFNTGTRESVWEKPDDLKTPFERALNQTKWKEYFSGGRKYYYNTDSKESKWDMPDELILLLEKVEKEGAAAPTPPNRITAPGSSSTSTDLVTLSAVNGQTPASSSTDAQRAASGVPPSTNQGALPIRPNLPEDPVIPHNGFATVEEGEKAFMHLLRKAGVDANWTWDQTMRTIITDPLYKALNTLAEKKAAWQKYTDALRAKEQEEREARLSKFRPAIRNMLKGNPNVFHYTTFTTADKLFAQHPIWQQAKIEAERKLIFEEYVQELKTREIQENRAARTRSINKVVLLFKSLDVGVLTRWRKAHQMVKESEEWQEDPELQKLATLDILLAFEDYSRVREREYEETMRRNQVEKTRRERKAREAFKDLLKGLVDSGEIKARTKWKVVYPTFKEDPRYLGMLGIPGSNPLELFWDVIDGLDQKLDAKILLVEEAIRKWNEKNVPSESEEKEKEGVKEGGEDEGEKKDEKEKGKEGGPNRFKVVPETTKEELLDVLREDEEVFKKLSDDELEEIYRTMHDEAIKRQADEKRRAERRQRHLQDDLRYALKKLSEPLDLNLSYEDAVPLMQDLPEYKALDDDEGRRAAFVKFIKRQKERLREKEEKASEDGGSTTSRRRKEPATATSSARDDRDRDRSRDRRHDREERDSHAGDRERERERDVKGSRHHRGHEEYDTRGGAGRSREYPRGGREKEYHHSSAKDRDRERERERDRDRERERDRERDYAGGYRSGRHHRDVEDERPERRGAGAGRRSSKGRGEYDDERGERGSERGAERERGYGKRDWDDAGTGRERSGSVSAYRDEGREKRPYDDRLLDERAEKRPRYEEETKLEPEVSKVPPARAETPEEGEI
ncbi:hypothetical protein QCA50_017488 [Cerrena zonata]|uniref:Formin binding protein n=1 Tax=Cerrena zonata TaxID=2478898 RepID=A0AAW0FMK5_9APHY